MEDSNSNISTSSSTIDVASNKSSEDPVNNSGKGLEQRFSSNIDSKPSSTSFSDTNVGGLPSNTSFQDSFSTGSSQEGASAFSGSQSMDTSLSGDQSSLDIGVFHTKRKLHGKDKKVCRVCGDKALGYNFNAMTCESCKAFFRRNALKQATPNCMFQGNCSVDIRTRRFCPHCRLKKCFSMGMKKEMILDEARLRARKKRAPPKSQKPKARDSVNDLSRATMVNNDGLSATKLSSSSGGDEIYCDTISASWDDLNVYSWSNTPNSSKSDQPYKQSWQAETNSPLRSFVQYRILSEKEQACLTQLKEKFVSAMETQLTGFSEALNEVKDFLNTSMIWAKKLVTYVKSVEDFKQLSSEAQVMSIKSCVRSALTLISGYRYDVSRNAYFIQGIYVSVEMFMRAFSSHKKVAEMFVNACLSMQDSWIKDPCVHALFHLILLFNPEGEDLLQRDLMSDLQNKYLILLKHYLESQYSFSESKEYFALILQKSRELRTLAVAFTEVLVNTDPQQIDPLTKEVYNFGSLDKP